ncbi:DUF1871 family protein [Bacillus sp. FJAT-42376]|uniref:DUF1871 family protein n=1 Tax=Bacillus sp. FJAT-42376 TaxID=2014076 RepID=UPI000F4E11CE|nr:DUF1871 family protein [Bacillus sp. FJAT-42376]AZB44213.1 DUF1871 family protein [Bacillus sp. FJAT-42376]
METQAANEIMMEILYKWDPFGFGEGFHDTEAVDVVQAVHILDQPGMLAEKIQAIYEHSSEKWIPMEECMKMAVQLLAIKEQAGC